MKLASRYITHFLGLILFCSFSCQISNAQIFENSNLLTIRGQIFSAKDTSALAQAHIINPIEKTGTVSDYKGLFALKVERGEQLIISALGYEADTILTDSLDKINHLVFYLEEKIFSLEDVVILPFPSDYIGFRNHFMDMKIDGAKYKLDLDLPSTTRGLSKIEAPPTGFGVAVASPISWLYNKFSKEAKSKREYLRLVTLDNYNARLAVKYNAEIVANLTGLKDEKAIETFMEYCNLSNPFVEQSDEYNILEAVQACWLSYQENK